jgi:hypothetical protein
MKLDAFVFNGKVCSGEDIGDKAIRDKRAKIAPITQPNYTFLRLHDALIQGDILPHVDIHNSFENEFNSRYCNIDTGEIYKDRQGVYLHWMLPRLYRVGVAAAGDEVGVDHGVEGLPGRSDEDSDRSAPQFRPVPTRWLVIRRLKQSIPDFKEVGAPEYQAWVIESDKQSVLDKGKTASAGEKWDPDEDPDVGEISDDLDIQVDLSPFISAPDDDSRAVKISKQAEILNPFIKP